MLNQCTMMVLRSGVGSEANISRIHARAVWNRVGLNVVTQSKDQPTDPQRQRDVDETRYALIVGESHDFSDPESDPDYEALERPIGDECVPIVGSKGLPEHRRNHTAYFINCNKKPSDTGAVKLVKSLGQCDANDQGFLKSESAQRFQGSGQNLVAQARECGTSSCVDSGSV
ncbi:hypothetical protein QAD02_000880 [Eretmocerus hayati]|uniref:Uncharacterized protein n=1 Tax=Eretmocerus hayati TaxID=131215 RepID=A0ACC2NEU9_9HYME|nr:hypothetical protein QAD02_000880 [Eretmocerus hayati]